MILTRNYYSAVPCLWLMSFWYCIYVTSVLLSVLYIVSDINGNLISMYKLPNWDYFSLNLLVFPLFGTAEYVNPSLTTQDQLFCVVDKVVTLDKAMSIQVNWNVYIKSSYNSACTLTHIVLYFELIQGAMNETHILLSECLRWKVKMPSILSSCRGFYRSVVLVIFYHSLVKNQHFFFVISSTLAHESLNESWEFLKLWKYYCVVM